MTRSRHLRASAATRRRTRRSVDETFVGEGWRRRKGGQIGRQERRGRRRRDDVDEAWSTNNAPLGEMFLAQFREFSEGEGRVGISQGRRDVRRQIRDEYFFNNIGRRNSIDEGLEVGGIIAEGGCVRIVSIFSRWLFPRVTMRSRFISS